MSRRCVFATTWIVAPASVAMLLTACTGDTSAPEPAPTERVTVTGTPLYLVDGNLGSRPIERLPAGAMTGVPGTVPGAPLDEEFRAELEAIDPDVSGAAYSYAPETFDAITVTALAAQAARTDAPNLVAAQMSEVSQAGKECRSFAECDLLLRQGEDINYEGVSGSVDFTDTGDIAAATIGVFTYDDQNLVPGYTSEASETTPQFVEAQSSESSESPTATSEPVTGPADGQLTFAALLAQSGDLKSFQTPIEAAAALAIEQVNEAGGVLGREVSLTAGDGADDTVVTSAETLLADGVDVVVSATSSNATLAVLDQFVGNGVLVVGSSQTAPELSEFDDAGLYFRTAPSDEMQGKVLADRIVSDGATQVAILARDDAYGRGLAEAVRRRLQGEGTEIATSVFFDPEQRRFDAEVAKVASRDPDAIVLVSFDEAAKIIKELMRQGIAPSSN